MNSQDVHDYLLSRPGAWADFPFDASTLVVKVKSKMFALLALESDPLRMNLKCDPQDADRLRAQYPAIQPGYHMNKRHWNTVILNGSLPDDLLKEMIDDSYERVFQKLTRAEREAVQS